MEEKSGKIIKAIGGFYYVKTDEGVFSCRAKGKFRKDGLSPLVGDDAQIAVVDKEKLVGNVEKILPRKSAFIRPPVANIDMLVITISSKEPSPDLLLADKLSVIAQKAGVTPCFCINKTDLDEEKAEEIAEIYRSAGFMVIKTCFTKGEGIEELKKALKGKTCAFAGNSGVGKSSLLRLVTGRDDLETGSVSDKIKRGKNTTRHTELIELKTCAVLDTPGFSSFEVEEIRAEELENLFPEIKKYTGNCYFGGCAHINEPKCSVKDALKEGKISKSRYENYIDLYNSLKEIKEWMR
ncbi:MAG: ribosome small subunit-dependent GTPase A [Clostridia bacterium]|nr:ribosome small subunit-dependent GTPase A [Clostridia bacterium]